MITFLRINSHFIFKEIVIINIIIHQIVKNLQNYYYIIYFLFYFEIYFKNNNFYVKIVLFMLNSNKFSFLYEHI